MVRLLNKIVVILILFSGEILCRLRLERGEVLEDKINSS